MRDASDKGVVFKTPSRYAEGNNPFIANPVTRGVCCGVESGVVEPDGAKRCLIRFVGRRWAACSGGAGGLRARKSASFCTGRGGFPHATGEASVGAREVSPLDWELSCAFCADRLGRRRGPSFHFSDASCAFSTRKGYLSVCFRRLAPVCSCLDGTRAPESGPSAVEGARLRRVRRRLTSLDFP